MSWFLTAVGIIVLVLFHEAGHFLAAKAVGMRVERFSLFFPPTLFSVRIGETDYAIGAIPLGGYVKIAGMSPAERILPKKAGQDQLDTAALATPGGEAQEHLSEAPAAELPEEDERGYFRQPVWKRLVVIGAGPAVNIVLAFAILWGVYAFSAQTPVPGRVRIAEVQSGHPASAVLRHGDLLLGIDGKPLNLSGEGAGIIQAINSDRCAGATVQGCRAAHPVNLELLRAGKRMNVVAYPTYDVKAGRMLLGFSFLRVLRPETLLGAASASIDEMGSVTGKSLSTFGKLFTSSRARSQLHGIVAISDVASQAFSFGIADALFVLALLSLSLAIVNLFPFLPLDGGHIFWAIAEKLRGRAISFAVMERASIIGVALVLGLFAIGLSNDISGLQNGSLTLHR